MAEVLFIVWRESIEALLVIGILNAWLRQNPAAARGRVYLWGGVLAGLVLAVLLALGLFAASEIFADKQDLFQLVMALAAAGLIVQMVLWMRRHGRTLKRDMETDLSKQAAHQNWWGVLILAAVAVGREGSETVVFLYGTVTAADKGTFGMMVLVGLLGFALALAVYGLLQLGSKLLSWKRFFRVTEIMLLLLAASLFTSGIERLISMDWLPALVDPVWDSSRWIDDTSPAGSMFASLTGYRAQPALTSLIAYGLFWLAIWGRIRQMSRRQL